MSQQQPVDNVHASCVALSPQRGVLILGASGSGKSAFALGLMGYGAQLVADDRVDLRAGADGLWASAPQVLSGLIEARGVGILNAEALDRAKVVLVVDLDREETERLPPRRSVTICGVQLPLVLRVRHGHLVTAVLQWMKAGRHA